MKSLRGRLFAGLTIVIALTGAIGSAVAYRWAYNEAIEMQDSVLLQIAAFARAAPVNHSGPINGVDAEAEVTVVELVAGLKGTGEEILSKLADGLHNSQYQARPVRALLRTRDDRSRFAVTQRTDIRTEIASDLALRTLLPIAALIPCLLLVTAIVIAHSFKPMVRLAAELDARPSSDLTALSGHDAPGELHPFLHSINATLSRLRAMIDQQQRFIADAAHELRTPVTALSIQAENLDQISLPPEARARVSTLKDGIGRTRRLLDQLLSLARQDAQASRAPSTVRLDRVAKDVVGELMPAASSKSIDIGFERFEDVVVEGHDDVLASLARNIIENAVKFAPERGRVDVSVYVSNASAILAVEDNGPGVAPEDIAFICEPFFRGQGMTENGSGIGLSIVKRIVDQLGGSVLCENKDSPDGARGFRVVVNIPRPPRIC